MTNKEIIEFSKKGKNNAKMALFTEGTLLSYLAGLITVIALENKEIEKEEQDISVRWMIKLNSLGAKYDDIDVLRIESIKWYLNMEKEYKRLVLKYKPELNKELLSYFRDVRYATYDGEDYDDYSLTLLG